MPIYKILNIGKEFVLSGNERWPSFEEALNELVVSGWKLQSFSNISVPQPEKFASEDWIATAVMENDQSSITDDIHRQIQKVENQLQKKQNEMGLSENDSAIKKTVVNQEVRELSNLLETLKEKLPSKSRG